MERSRVSWGIGSRAVVRLGIHSSSLVLDISYEATLVICMVGNYLDTTIRQGYSVLSSHHAVLILDLLLCKVSSGVGILKENGYNNLIMIMFIFATILELRTRMRKVWEESCMGHGVLGVGRRVQGHGAGEQLCGVEERRGEVLVPQWVRIEEHQGRHRQILT